MQDTRDVIIDVDLKPNDVYTPLSWNRGNLVRWVASILICLIVHDLYRNSRETILSFDGGGSILAIMALLLVLVLCGLLLFPYLRVRAMFRKSQFLTKARRYTIGNGGIATKTDDAATDSKWSAFRNVFETPAVFIFALSPFQAMHVPKRCFASTDDIARVRDLVRENLPGKSKLRND
jgi:hypothetical protein